MTQLTLFASTTLDRQPVRERNPFDSHALASRFAQEALGSGIYSDVYIIKVLDKSVVITEREP